MPLDTSQINAIQDYYRDEGQQLALTIMEERATETFMTPLSFKDVYRHNIGESESGMIQSYQTPWTPRGNVIVRPREQRNVPWKVDITFDPGKHNKQAYESWLAQTGNDPYDMPYAAFITDQVFRQIGEDLELQIAWQGKELGVIADAPNPSQDVMDGLIQKALTAAYAGETPVVITGPITFTNAVSVIERFVKGALSTPAKRRQRWNCFCSIDTADKYKEDRRAKYGANTFAQEFDEMRVEGTNTFLVPVAGLYGSELFLGQQGNMFFGFDGEDLNFLIERRRREIDFIIDGKFSYDFRIAQQIYINEQCMLQPS